MQSGFDCFQNLQASSFVGCLLFVNWCSGIDLHHCRADGQRSLGTAVLIGAHFG
jgi:hypothetical protein